MDKILSAILIIIISIVLVVFSLFYFAFGDHKELEKIKNPINGEKIFLMKVSWGINDDRMAIGLDRKFSGGFAKDFDDKYLKDFGEYFFYKFSNDSLLIYGYKFKPPLENNFITPIRFINLENAQFIYYGENEYYKKLGLSVFPKSKTKMLEYRASREK